MQELGQHKRLSPGTPRTTRRPAPCGTSTPLYQSVREGRPDAPRPRWPDMHQLLSFGPGTPLERFDYEEGFLRDMFRLLGIDDFTVIRAEGLASSDRDAVLKQACARISQLR